jgi:hypothetical protein
MLLFHSFLLTSFAFLSLFFFPLTSSHALGLNAQSVAKVMNLSKSEAFSILSRHLQLLSQL